MFKSWRKATAGSTAGRIGRRFHRVLSRVALPAVLIAALVATPLQILTSPAEIAQAQTEDPITVSFAEATYNVIEGSTVNVTVEVSADAPTNGYIIPITALQSDQGERVTSLAESVTIQSGQTSATLEVAATANEEADGNYVLDLVIDSTATNFPLGLTVVTPSIARVNIIDDESPNIQLSAYSQSVFEGTDFTVTGDPPVASNQEATWTVQLTEDPGADVEVTVTISSSDPGAATVDPPTLTFTGGIDGTWDDTQEVTVTGVEDANFVGETVMFTHAASGGDYGSAATRAVRVSVTDDDTPELILSPTSMFIQEGITGRYTVKLNGQPKETTVVRFSVPEAQQGLVNVSRERITFRRGDWNKARVVEVEALQDEDQNNNSVIIGHTAEGAEFDGLSKNFAVVIEDDDKPGIRVSTNRVNVGEGGTVSWRVRLNTAPTSDVTVTLASPDPDAVTVEPAELIFTTSNWGRDRTVTATAVEDDDFSDETVSITHDASGGGYETRPVRVVAVAVDDDEEASVLLSVDSLEVAEGGTNSYMVTLAAQPQSPVTIAVASSEEEVATVAISDGGALSADNWDTGLTVTVTGVPETDADDTDDDEVTITHTSTYAEFADLDLKLPVTIVDDDRPGIKVSVGSVTVFEGTSVVSDESGAAQATWTVQLNTEPTADVVVTISSSDAGAATASTAANTSVITFTNTTISTQDAVQWNIAQTITVTGAADNDIEPEEVTFTHTAASSGDENYDGVTAEVLVTVTDDADARIELGGVGAPDATTDPPTPHTITVSEGTTSSYTLKLTAQPSATTVVWFTVQSDEITVAREKITFRRGDWNKPRTTLITAPEDEDNLDATILITHTATAGGGYEGQVEVLRVTIEDNDKPGIQVSRANIGIQESGSGTFTVRLNTEPTSNVTVTVEQPTGGDNTENADVTFEPATLEFTTENWDEAQTVTVTAADDTDVSDDTATIQLRVSSTDDTTYVTINRNVEVTINDDDDAGFMLSDTAVTVREGDTSAEAFTIVLTSEPSQDVTVTFESSDTDKAASPAEHTFSTSNWNQLHTVSLSVTDETDTADLTDDSVTITIRTAVTDDDADPFHGLTDTVAVTIEDDDKAGIQVDPKALTVFEGTSNTDDTEGEPATWTVQLNTEPTADVVVTISSSDASRATASTSVITFTNDTNNQDAVLWSAAQTVTVSSHVDDDIVNDDVTFTHSVTSGAYAAEDAEVVVTVDDNADARIVTDLTAVTDSDQVLPDAGITHTITVPEGGTVSYTLNLSAKPTATTVVSFSEDSDLISLNRERITFRRGDWHRPRATEITAGTDDNAVDETVVITHTASAGGGYGGQMIVVQVTIDDTNKPGLQLRRTGITVAEGGSGTFTVRLNTEPSNDVTVTPSVSGDEAVTVLPATLTFTDETWEEPQTITVSAAEDDNAVNDTFTIALAVTSSDDNYSAEQNKTVSVTVDDNDSAGMTVSATSVTVREGAEAVAAFTVVLTAAPVGTVTVAFTSSDETKVTAPAQITFSSDIWSTPQPVLLAVANEPDTPVNTADTSARIDIATSVEDLDNSADAAFNGLTASVAVAIEDDDKDGIQLSRTTQTVFEGTNETPNVTGTAGSQTDSTWTVRLNTDPGVEVVVTISSSDASRATASTAANTSVITFTNDTNNNQDAVLWSAAQTVTVSSDVDDDIVNDEITFTHSVTSGAYAAADAEVVVTVMDSAVATIVTDLTVLDQTSLTDAGVTHTITVPEGGTASFTMNLSARPTATTVVSFAEDSDFISVNRERITFRGGDWSKARTSVITAGTDVNTADETAIITFTASAGGGYDGEMIVLEVTIDDSGKPGLQLNRTGLTIGEGGKGTFTVRLNTEPTDDVTVTPRVEPANDAVTFLPETLTFTDETWEEPQTITVSAAEDDDAVNDETGIMLTVSSDATGYGTEQNKTVSVTVDDNDNAGMKVSATSVTVREGAMGVAAFTVVLTAAPVGEVRVSFTSSDDTKVDKPSDITFNNSDWDALKTVQLSVDDETGTTDTADDSATITIETDATNEADTGFNDLTASVAVAIEDDDKAGIQLDRTTQTVFEGTNQTPNAEGTAGSGTESRWTVRLNTDPGVEVVVTISSSDASRATVTPSVITFTAGGGSNWETAVEVTVESAADDDIVNDDVTFTHSVTSGAYAAADAEVVVTVMDSAVATIVTDLTVLDQTSLTDAGVTHTITVPEGGTASFTMNLSARPTATTVVSFAEDSDFISVNRERITFRGGDWSKARTSVITAGTDVNTVDETAIMTFTASAGGGYDGEMIVLEVTIDDSGKPGLQLNRTGLTIGEGGKGTFTVRLNTEPTDDVTVTPRVEPANDAVTFLPETLTFTDETWEEPQTITVSAAEDDDAVNDETGIMLTVSSDATGYGTEQNKTVSVTVDDNDNAGMKVSATSVTVREGAMGVAAFTVVLTAAPVGEVRVSFTSSDDTKVDKPSDITFNNSDWDALKTVQLSVDDETGTTDTADDSATITIETDATNEADTGFNDLTASVAVAIEDDDKAGIQLDRTTQTVFEGTNQTPNAEGTGGSGDESKWTVRLNTDPGAEVTVTITSEDTSKATVDKTSIKFASSASDSDVFLWSDAKEVTVTGVADNDIAHESIRFTHSIASAAYAAADATVVVTVTDDADAAIVVGGLTVAEQADLEAGYTHAITVPEGGTRSYTMNLSARPSATTVVSFAEDSDSISVDRERITFRGGDWHKPRTNVITAAEDDDSMDNTAVITHTASAGGGYDGQTVVVKVTIDDNDKAGILLSRSSMTIDEEGEGTFTVRLQTEPMGDVTLTLDQPTNPNTDVTTDPMTTLTFTADNWDDTQTVTVKAADDADVANDTASIRVRVTAGEDDTGYVAAPARTVAVTVTDNDSAGLVLSANSVTISEDANATDAFTVKLAGQPSAQVTVEITTEPAAVTDIATSITQQLTFGTNGWDTPQAVRITPVDDADSDDASFTIKLAAAGGGYDDLTASVAVKITDINKPGIKLSKPSSSIAEGATDTWTVQLNEDPGDGETVKVTISSSDSGAATVDETELTFTGDSTGQDDGTWDAPQTVTVTGEEDSDIADESVTFTHSVTSGDYDADAVAVTVAVEDNETASIVVNTMAITMDEGTTASYTMKLSAQPNSTAVVRFSEDSDKLSVDRERITFRRNDWHKERTNVVTAAEDDDMDDETITIVHTAEGDNSGYAGQTVNVVVTIIDNDSPSLMIGTTSATVAEEGTTSWTVRLNTKPDTNVTVEQTVVAGDGANADQTAVTVTEGASLIFTPDNWDKPQTVKIMGADDADLANETAAVTHTPSGATGYTAEIARTVPVSITDNDTASLVLSKTTVEVTEGDIDVTVTDAFNVKLSAMPASEVTITVSSNNTDVEIASDDESLTIQPNDWNTGDNVSLTIKADDESDDERATISLSASGAEFAGKTGSVVVNVTDNDQPGITVSKSEITLDMDADTDNFTVVLNTNPGGNVTVRVSSSDGGAVKVSAAGGQAADFVDLTFTDLNWAEAQTVSVAGQDDADVGDESVTISVAATSGYSVSGKSVAVTVTDDDTGSMTVDPTTLTVTEGSTATYTVVLDQQPGGNVTVTLANSTPAAATLNNATLTFTTSDWNQAKTVTVTGVEDDDAENGSTTIGHTAEGGGFEIASSQDDVTVTVTDNDQPELILSRDTLTVAEAGGTGTYTVRLKTEPTGTVAVQVESGTTAKATVDKSSLTFTTQNWSQAQTVTVTGVPDDTDATDDEVTITNDASGGGYGGANVDKNVTVTVNDDDTVSYKFDMREVTVTEGGTHSITLSVNIAEPSGGRDLVFDITVVTSGGASHPVEGENNTGDYSGVPSTVTISAGQASTDFTVTIRDDDDDDDGESIHIVASPPDGVSAGDITVVTINITDNDTQ